MALPPLTCYGASAVYALWRFRRTRLALPPLSLALPPLTVAMALSPCRVCVSGCFLWNVFFLVSFCFYFPVLVCPCTLYIYIYVAGRFRVLILVTYVCCAPHNFQKLSNFMLCPSNNLENCRTLQQQASHSISFFMEGDGVCRVSSHCPTTLMAPHCCLFGGLVYLCLV